MADHRPLARETARPTPAQEAKEPSAESRLDLPPGYRRHYGLTPPSGSGQPLPPEVLRPMESALGIELSALRAHVGAEAESVGAQAFARGTHLHFAPGAYDPQSPQGRRLIAHEVVHVLQQARGGVATDESGLNTDAALESQAEQLGDQVAAGERVRLWEGALTPREEGPIQRVQITVTVKKITIEDLLQKTIVGLDEYVRTQVNWYETVDGINEAEERQIVDALLFARNTPGILAALGTLPVKRVRALSRQDRERLARYGGALSGEMVSVRLRTPALDLREALAWGAALEALSEIFSGPHLRQIFSEEMFLSLVRDQRRLALFLAYCQGEHAPILHAIEGRDVESFLRFCELDGEGPAHFRGELRWIYNFHRFSPTVLKKLSSNEGGSPEEGQRVTVIVYSAFDHNAAFHWDDSLAEAVLNERNFALVIECGGIVNSLDAIGQQLAYLRERYGKIHQVMFLGHGTSRSMQMCGSLSKEGQPQNERMDLDGNDGATHELLLYALDSIHEEGTVLFNACLTDSTEYRGRFPSESHSWKRDIQRQLAGNASLANRLRQLAAKRGQSVQVIGAKGSFGKASIADETGQLTLSYDRDPKLTASNKEYVLHGYDTEGAMNALLACLVADGSATGLVADRLSRESWGWKPLITRIIFEILEKLPARKMTETLIRLQSAAATLSHCIPIDEHTVASLVAALPKEFAMRIIGRICEDRMCSGPLWLVMALAELALVDAAAPGREFLESLGANGYDCAQLSDSRVIDLDWLCRLRLLARLLTLTPRSPNQQRGQILMALYAALDRRPLALEYLRSLLGQNVRFDSRLEIPKLLKVRTESELLELLGHRAADAEVQCNFNPEGHSHNDMVIQSLSAIGTVLEEAPLFSLPPQGHEGCVPSDGLPAGATVVVMGVYQDGHGHRWYLIMRHSKSCFVDAERLQLESATELGSLDDSDERQGSGRKRRRHRRPKRPGAKDKKDTSHQTGASKEKEKEKETSQQKAPSLSKVKEPESGKDP